MEKETRNYRNSQTKHYLLKGVLTISDLPITKKGGSKFGWFLFGLLILGTIGATIYMADKDSASKESTEN